MTRTNRLIAQYEKQREFCREAKERGTLAPENVEHLGHYARELLEAVGLGRIREICSQDDRK